MSGLVALRQWIIQLGASQLVVDHVVVGNALAPKDAPKLLADLDELESRLRVTRNRLLRSGWGSYDRVVGAYAAMGVRFLSPWEETEIDVRAALAAGRYDSWESFKSSKAPASLTFDELWLLVMHGGDVGVAKAKPLLLAQADETAAQGYAASAAYDRWLATGNLDASERASMMSRFQNAKAPLVTKPVKTEEKLDRQIGAFVKGEFDRTVLEKSFKQWFGYCYHPESPSNFSSKETHVIAHNVLVKPARPEETLAYVKSCLAMFSPARVAARRVFVLDVEPIAEALAAIRRAALRPPPA